MLFESFNFWIHICFVKSCPSIMSSTHSSPLFGLIVSWFWVILLDLNPLCFDLLVPFIFCLSSYLCLDLHKFLYINSIVFIFWSVAVFLSSFSRISCFTYSVLAVLFQKIIFPHRKFLILWNMQDWGVTEKTKKKISSKESIEKNDKYFKNSVQSGRYSWRNWTLNLKNL